MPPDELLRTIGNLARFHREHDQFYSQAPLRHATEIQTASRALKSVAGRWAEADPNVDPVASPFAGAVISTRPGSPPSRGSNSWRGAWTHAGYLNWDTGYGHPRWHLRAVLGVRAAGAAGDRHIPALLGAPRPGSLGQGAVRSRAGALPPARRREGQALAPKHMFVVHVRMEAFECYCARMLANATRAVAMGLGSLPAKDPPPLYAYDYDTGRLAVTTPSYSTAILADNRGTIAYGGIDPARLFADGQRVAFTVGGTPPGAFGVVIAGADGHEALASQHARVRRRLALRLVRSPRGRVRRPRAYPATPYAGPSPT